MAVVVTASTVSAALGQSAAEYLNHDATMSAARRLARAANVDLDTLARTGQGRDVIVLTLSADPSQHASKPAVLITAGLDGGHLVGTETALRVASLLSSDHAEWLDDVTVYVIPQVNPDGAHATMSADGAMLMTGNLRTIDDDRDGLINEDPPTDINGDGVITMMRRLEPTLDDAPTHLADPADPRLNKTPATADGERAVFTLYPEGLDADGDGTIAEDGPGMVDLDQNFVQDWPAYTPIAGPVPLSEPETLALARFVVDHPNIMAAITYGRHDNLVNAPDGKGKGPLNRIPKNVHEDDLDLYKAISTVFGDVTTTAHAPSRDTAGSFHRWLYAHRGIPSFATTVWSRPSLDDADDSNDDPATEVADIADDTAAGQWTGEVDVPDIGGLNVTIDLKPAADGTLEGTLTSEMFSFDLTGTFDSGSLALKGELAPGAPVALTGAVTDDTYTATVSGPNGESFPFIATRQQAVASSTSDDAKPSKPDTPQDKNGAAWLAYAETLDDTIGFVEWTPFDHPTLGSVEIGGFTPGFQMNPPASALDTLAAEQTAFVGEIIERRPSLRIVGPEVNALGGGLYDLRVAVVNDGVMPTRTALAAQARSTLPMNVRLSVPIDRIVTGQRVQQTWRIDGHGGRATFRWMVRLNDDEQCTITIQHPQLGERAITMQPGGEG
ncbi:MAG: M14 family zinc carboxypeptidase [Planctomycetota bacterium]